MRAIRKSDALHFDEGCSAFFGFMSFIFISYLPGETGG
jgi:hypothetical protein